DHDDVGAVDHAHNDDTRIVAPSARASSSVKLLRRVLRTGMSGTSTAPAELHRRGCERWIPTTRLDDVERRGRRLRGERIAELLARGRTTTLYLSGTVSNQGRFYRQKRRARPCSLVRARLS